MATDEEELLTALGAKTIPQLPLSSKLYEFKLTAGYPNGGVVGAHDDQAWHLVSVMASFDRFETQEWPPGAPASVKVVKYEPQVVILWARRKT